MRKLLTVLPIISFFACSNQVPPTSQEIDDLGVMLVTDDQPSFSTIDIDERVFYDVTTLGESNEGCVFESSGPYNRIQTDPDLTGSVNAVSATIYLPRTPASADLSDDNPTQSRYTPNVYTGGKVEGGAPIDVGFYSERNGLWVPFINAKPNGIPIYTNLLRVVINGKNYAYRIKPGTNVSIKTWVSANDTISFAITGDWVQVEVGVAGTPKQLGVSTRVFSNPNARGWKTSGENIAWKFMTTVAIQPVRTGAALITGNYSFNGSSWSGIRLATANAAGDFSSSVPFTSSLQFQSSTPCVKPSDVVTASVGLPNISVNIKLRVKGKYMRTPVNPLELIGSLGEKVTKKLTVTNTASTPSSKVILNFTPPGGTQLAAKALTSGAKLEIPFSYSCASEGKVDKQFNVVYSENDTETSNVLPLVAGGYKYLTDTVTVTLNCIKNLDYTPTPLTYTGVTDVAVTKTAPGTIGFKNNAGKFTYTATSSDANLLQIVKVPGSALNGETTTIETKIVCTTVVQKEVSVTVTINNGKDTKTEVVKVPVNCKTVKASINVTPSTGLTFEVPIGSSETQNITISNTGDIGSSLEYNQYGVSQSGVVLSQAASGGGLARAMSVQPGTYPSGPPPLVWANGTITPNSAQAGTLTKSGTDASSVVLPVNVNCTKPEIGLTSVISVAYLTGETKVDGTPMISSMSIPVSVKCIGVSFADSGLTSSQLIDTIEDRVSYPDGATIFPFNTVYISNVGVSGKNDPATLRYTVTSSWANTIFDNSGSGILPPQGGNNIVGIQMKFPCSKSDYGFYPIKITVTTNDTYNTVKPMDFTLKCQRAIFNYTQPKIVGVINQGTSFPVLISNTGNTKLDVFGFGRNPSPLYSIQYGSVIDAGNSGVLNTQLVCGEYYSWGKISIYPLTNDYLNSTFSNYNGTYAPTREITGWYVCTNSSKTIAGTTCYVQRIPSGQTEFPYQYAGDCHFDGKIISSTVGAGPHTEIEMFNVLGLNNPMLDVSCRTSQNFIYMLEYFCDISLKN